MSDGRYTKNLVDAFLSVQTKKDMDDFLVGILTPQEREELGKRLEIVKLLKKGVPQHEIAKKLHVGVATVTRGSKEIQNGRFTNIA